MCVSSSSCDSRLCVRFCVLSRARALSPLWILIVKLVVFPYCVCAYLLTSHCFIEVVSCCVLVQFSL